MRQERICVLHLRFSRKSQRDILFPERFIHKVDIFQNIRSALPIIKPTEFLDYLSPVCCFRTPHTLGQKIIPQGTQFSCFRISSFCEHTFHAHFSKQSDIFINNRKIWIRFNVRMVGKIIAPYIEAFRKHFWPGGHAFEIRDIKLTGRVVQHACEIYSQRCNHNDDVFFQNCFFRRYNRLAIGQCGNPDIVIWIVNFNGLGYTIYKPIQSPASAPFFLVDLFALRTFAVILVVIGRDGNKS